MLNKKKKHVAIFVIDDGANYDIIGRKTFSITKDQISFKKKSFTITPYKSFSRGLTKYYYFDFNSGQLFIEQNQKDIQDALEIMDLICNKYATKHLMSASESKKDWMSLILGLAAGVGVGFMIAYFIF